MVRMSQSSPGRLVSTSWTMTETWRWRGGAVELWCPASMSSLQVCQHHLQYNLTSLLSIEAQCVFNISEDLLVVKLGDQESFINISQIR